MNDKKSTFTFLNNVVSNIVANIAVVLLSLLTGWVVAFYVGNPQIALLIGILVLVVCNILLTLRVLQAHGSELPRDKAPQMFRNPITKTEYLMDSDGKDREIPDADTSSFLQYILNIAEIRDMPSEITGKLRGDRLISMKNWKRPLTEEEKAKKELWHRLHEAFVLTDSSFDEKAIPQKIRIQMTNYGDKPVYVKKARFQHHSLPAVALLPSYTQEHTHTIIPLDQAISNILPGGTLATELNLRQKWQRADIDRIKGRWGFLMLDVVYEGMELDLLLQI